MTELLVLPLLMTISSLGCLTGAFWSSALGLEDRAFRMGSASILFAIVGLALIFMGSFVE